MPSRPGRNRPSLSQGLDREVYQVIRKIVDERQQYGDQDVRMSFALVYDEIKRSNSSLNRKNKKILEDSIERVLETMELDADDSAPDSGNKEDARPNTATKVVEKPPSNGLNRSIVNAWARSTPNGSSTPKRETEQEAGESSQHTNKRRQANGEPLTKKRKAATSTIDKSPPTHVSLADLGGVDDVIQQFEDILVLPMIWPERYAYTKSQPPRGILIHGPPGCGKTTMANAWAAELGVNFISISAPSIVSGMSGESEKALREHFDEAKKSAPCLMFIDEIDAITPKREGAQREMEKRIVAQLATCMDDLALEKTDGKPVIVLAATNRPDSLDPALRRGGRFGKEISMNVPNQTAREQILRALTRQMIIADDVDFEFLAKRTPGFVGADLSDLVSAASEAADKRCLSVLRAESEATMEIDGGLSTEDSTASPDTAGPPIPPKVLSVRRLIKHTYEIASANPSELAATLVSNSDFLTALPTIQPSALREGFATIPSTTFADIGALSTHRAELDTAIILPILEPSLYKNIGITPAAGLLLWGPPGCGKTLLAKAVANESKANFISVKGPELLNKYVGESEKAVRQVFARARSSIPVVIFFDELDALVPRRDGSMSEASARVVNTMLTELDGVGAGRDGIYIIGATNRPDMIDPAMRRPGRLETLLYVGLPSADERVEILATLARRLPRFAMTPAIAAIARAAHGFSGADLESLLRKAGACAVKRRSAAGIELPDFQAASRDVHRSVAPDEMKRYDRLKAQWEGATL